MARRSSPRAAHTLHASGPPPRRAPRSASASLTIFAEAVRSDLAFCISVRARSLITRLRMRNARSGCLSISTTQSTSFTCTAKRNFEGRPSRKINSRPPSRKTPARIGFGSGLGTCRASSEYSQIGTVDAMNVAIAFGSVETGNVLAENRDCTRVTASASGTSVCGSRSS